jgi:hypothetical protein
LLLVRAAPMGYNSWYDLMCSPYMNETTLERTADAMVTKGLVALGYVRVCPRAAMRAPRLCRAHGDPISD